MGQAITSVYDTELEKVRDQLATAAALRKQGLSQDIGQGYHGGRVYMVGNPLSNVVAGVGGALLDRQARQRQGELEQQDVQARNDFLAQMPSATETQHYDPVANPGTGPLVEGMEVAKSPRALAQATQAWAAKAPRGMEGVQNFALQQALTAPQRQAEMEQRAQDRAVQLEAIANDRRIAEQARRDQAIELEKMRQEGRILLKSMGGAGGGSSKPQLVYGDDGQAFHLLPDSSLRKIEGLKKPLSAAQQKFETEQAGKAAAKGKVEGAADEVLAAMEEAHRLGASPDKSTNPAVAAGQYLLSTEKGKEVGRALNLPLQTARDIADTKKVGLFLDTVKSSVTASQLNSDKELQFYMQTLGNPRSSYEAQVEAVKYIKKNYGKQMPGGGAPAPAAPAAKTVVREVPLKDGRIGVEYSDGTRGYK